MSKADRGFASMDPEEVKQISSLGGYAAQEGHGNRFDSERGRKAARKRWQVQSAKQDSQTDIQPPRIKP